jgi:hypothetical protein
MSWSAAGSRGLPPPRDGPMPPGRAAGWPRRRRGAMQAGDEFVRDGLGAHGRYLHAGGTIEHPAGEAQAGRQVVDEGAESHALDDAGDVDASGDHGAVICAVHFGPPESGPGEPPARRPPGRDWFSGTRPRPPAGRGPPEGLGSAMGSRSATGSPSGWRWASRWRVGEAVGVGEGVAVGDGVGVGVAVGVGGRGDGVGEGDGTGEGVGVADGTATDADARPARYAPASSRVRFR